MKKQQIILIVVVVIIFAGLIYLGVRQTPKQENSVNNQPIENNTLPTVNNNESGAAVTSTIPSAANPGQSAPLKPAEVPEEAIKISITEQGITPTTFTVKAGEEVTMSISSGDQWTHIFKFRNEALKAVAVGIGPKETRAISFVALKEKGEYEYYCDVPGHTERGEKGIMIIK